MGCWSTSLFGNDTTSDVRDDYISYLEKGLSTEEAYEKIMGKSIEYIGDDEEPLFWFALAASQWKVGRLAPEVKEKALYWLSMDGGLDLWEDSPKGMIGWKKTLAKLKLQLESPMPPEKKFRKPVEFVTNPWNINDIYAYQFQGKSEATEKLAGKYIVMQKICDYMYNTDGDLFSVIQVYDRVFDELPCLDDIDGVRLLPLVGPYKNDECTEKTSDESIRKCMNARMIYVKRHQYKPKRFTYIGNKKMPSSKIRWDYSFWGSEEYYGELYLKWQGAEYKIHEEDME